MKLTDLDPRWSRFYSAERGSDGPRFGMSFRCPHCADRGDSAQRIHVAFKNPLDGGTWDPPPGSVPKTLWERTGETFETITLTPSVDASIYLSTNEKGEVIRVPWGHWHGFITNGAIT